jgi:hypothetical protein
MKNGCKIALFFLCGAFSLSSVAAISLGADKTPECLKKVNWERDAFTPVDSRKVEGEFFEEGNERVYVASKAFDDLAECAYRDFRSVNGTEVATSINDLDLDVKFHTYGALFQFRDLDRSVDLLLGGGTVNNPTVFVHAESQGSPISVIVYGRISYTRSPNFPGRCDDLKGRTEDYEWCTGKRQPGPQDPRLTACKNQFCPVECPRKECVHIRDVPRSN